MKKRILLFVLTLSMLLTLSPAAFAAEAEETTGPAVREPGQCGETMYWSFDDYTGTLTITGSGDMDDFEEAAPWDEYREEITTVVLEGEICYIGARAFKDYDALTAVDFGTSLYEIGSQAFYSCGGLTVIALPATFKIFGEESFRGCSNLTEIHSAGRFPSFRENCMWDVYCTIYFPEENPWNVNTIAQLEEAFKGRIEFLASDGSDPYEPTEATEETTAPTEETVEETAEATTEAATAPTEVPTEAVTEATEETHGEDDEVIMTPADSETEETEPTEAQAPSDEGESSGGGWIGALIVAAVLAVCCVGFLLFAPKKKGGKYAR